MSVIGLINHKVFSWLGTTVTGKLRAVISRAVGWLTKISRRLVISWLCITGTGKLRAVISRAVGWLTKKVGVLLLVG